MSGLIDMTNGEIPGVNPLDYNMAMQIGETLHKAYPGHLWAVTCEGDKGIATVRNLALIGNWGFVLKLSDIFSASDWEKKVRQAGGEILERFRLKRGVADQEAIIELPTDWTGRKTLGDYAK